MPAALPEHGPRACVRAGTILHADLWAVPRGAAGGSGRRGPSPLLEPWLDFCTAPQRAQPGKGLRFGAAPALLPPPSGGGTAAQQHSTQSLAESRVEAGGLTGAWGGLPGKGVLARSEFLLPLDTEARGMLWDVLHVH